MISVSAQEAPITASSIHSSEYLPHYVCDGDPETRWASKTAGRQWLQLDLGRVMMPGDIRILWEHACAAVYAVAFSADGENWSPVIRRDDGAPGETIVETGRASGRYIRIRCEAPGEFSLYSIYEITFSRPAANAAIRQAIARHENRRREAEQKRAASLLAELKKTAVTDLVFATRAIHPDSHWYANIGYYATDADRKTWVSGSGLYRLHIPTGEVTPLVEDPEGTLRDPAVHYDGQTILFSWRKGGTEYFHLYTINADGSGLRQLTSGPWDDFEAAWLPDGGIIFVSTRCRRWVNCWLTQVANLHRCDADGRHIVPLSANLEHDNTPWPLPDGRILYMRWEYIDRSQVDYHHLWTMNPDGANEQVFYGNMHPGGVYIDAKPIPDSREVILINSPGHGTKEHAGHVALVTPDSGPDHRPSLRNITPAGFRDPFPLGRNLFLAARGRDIVLLDREGAIYPLFSLRGFSGGAEIHEPRPLLPAARAHRIPDRTAQEARTGRMILTDVYHGRNMEGVARGEVAKLLVVEPLPKPVNYTGGMDPLTWGGSFTLERILGTVPVRADGSAYMELPANRPVFFIALGHDNNTVKRMQSFTRIMPGETLGCAGCHEPRTSAAPNPAHPQLMALRKAPDPVTPVPGIPEVFDFPRDIQPILDRHCTKCHGYEKREGAEHGPRARGVILNGDRGPMFSHSYAVLTAHRQVSDGRDQAVSNYAPRTLGAAASPLMHKILEGHHGVCLTGHEIDMIRYWIETGAAYPGTYGALGGGAIGGYHENQQIETDYDWPESREAARLIRQRCLGCHKGPESLPPFLSHENGLSFWRPDWNDPRLKQSRHIVFNLSRPALSLMLLAPLAEDAGGYGLCREKAAGPPVFENKEDPAYQAILAMCRAGKKRLGEIKRFDMDGFQPPAPYLREMRRYGILAEDHTGPADPYVLDRAYWRSFHHENAIKHPACASTRDTE
jgi:hypothetical protein